MRIVCRMRPPQEGKSEAITVDSTFTLRLITKSEDITAPKESKRAADRTPPKGPKKVDLTPPKDKGFKKADLTPPKDPTSTLSKPQEFNKTTAPKSIMVDN